MSTFARSKRIFNTLLKSFLHTCISEKKKKKKAYTSVVYAWLFFCLFTWPHGSSLTTFSDVGESSGLLWCRCVVTLSILDGGVLSNCRPAGTMFGSIIDRASEVATSESTLSTCLVRFTLPLFELILAALCLFLYLLKNSWVWFKDNATSYQTAVRGERSKVRLLHVLNADPWWHLTATRRQHKLGYLALIVIKLFNPWQMQ